MVILLICPQAVCWWKVTTPSLWGGGIFLNLIRVPSSPAMGLLGTMIAMH